MADVIEVNAEAEGATENAGEGEAAAAGEDVEELATEEAGAKT